MLAILALLKKPRHLVRRNFPWIIEISVKSGKDSTSTLSLVIHRVRFLKKPAKKYISIQQGVKLRWFPEFHPCLSFFLSASTAATKIFTAPTCTATIIPLELCALNAEIQHFILRFNKISLLC